MALNPENLTTTKDESSSDFGARVLKDVRLSNQAKEEEFFKRQKREQDREDLFKLVTPLAVGVGDAFFQNKADAFLNTEENALKVLTTRNAYKLAKSTTEEEEQARKFEGGYRAYFNRQGEERARADVQKEFGAKGTYSENQFTETLQSLGMDIGEQLREAHEKRLGLTKEYLSSRGGIEEGQDVYLNEVKKHTPDTLSKGITRGITNFLGLTPRQQISQRAERIFGSAERLVNYQKLYETTGDEVVAKSLEEILPKNIQNPAMTVGDETKFYDAPSNLYGGDDVKRPYRDAMIYDRATNSKQYIMLWLDEQGNPTGEIQSRANHQQHKGFNAAVAEVFNDEKIKSYYRIAWEEQVPEDIRDKINAEIKKQVHSQLSVSATGTARTDEEVGYTDRLVSRIGGAARIIQTETGLEADAANKIALNMFLSDYSISGINAFQDGAGVMSPYATLNAMVASQQDARVTSIHVNNMIGRNGINIVHSYLNASPNQRKRMQQNFETFIKNSENDTFSRELATPMRQVHNVATEIANQDLGDISLDQKIIVAKEILALRAEELKKLNDGVTKDTPTVTVNPEEETDVLEWIKDNPETVMTLVGTGLLLTPPSWFGAAVAGTAMVGTRLLQAGKAAWKFKKPAYDWMKKTIKNHFYIKKDMELAPHGVNVATQTLSRTRAAGAAMLAAPPVIDAVTDAVPSLLANPKAPIVIPETVAVPEAVEDKISFVGDILGDDANAITFMQKVVNQESNFGKNPNTYNMSADGEGRFGVAQVDRVAFNQVQKKLQDPNSSIFKFLKPFEDKTGIDLRTLSYSDLKEDVFSIAFGRLYLQQLTDEPIPTTLEEQAAYWKKYYNTSAGRGTPEDFIATNKSR